MPSAKTTRYAIISEHPQINTDSLSDIRKVALVKGNIVIKERLGPHRERIMYLETNNGRVVNTSTGQHLIAGVA